MSLPIKPHYQDFRAKVMQLLSNNLYATVREVAYAIDEPKLDPDGSQWIFREMVMKGDLVRRKRRMMVGGKHREVYEYTVNPNKDQGFRQIISAEQRRKMNKRFNNGAYTIKTYGNVVKQELNKGTDMADFKDPFKHPVTMPQQTTFGPLSTPKPETTALDAANERVRKEAEDILGRRMQVEPEELAKKAESSIKVTVTARIGDKLIETNMTELRALYEDLKGVFGD